MPEPPAFGAAVAAGLAESGAVGRNWGLTVGDNVASDLPAA